MKKENLNQLFISELKDLLNAEEQIIKALPKMVDAAESPKLKEAFETHFGETKNHVERLKKIFHLLQLEPKSEKCEAMEGLIQECKEALNEFPESSIRDAALISKAQRIEHYEISVYGTLRTFAKELGLDKVKKLLQETLDEEANADKSLTKIAEGGLLTSGINHKANY